MDEITIAYSVSTDPATAPNDCVAATDYKGQAVKAHGLNWAEAKNGCLSRCSQLKALGEPPPDETIDLDPPEAAKAA